VTTVEVGDWAATLADLRDAGYGFLDYLTAIDRLGHIELVAHVVDPHSHAHVLVTTSVDSPHGRVDSVAWLFPGANWHEREVAEMFGVEFVGHPDPRPLLLREPPGQPPMLKASVLTARVATPLRGGA
jgi:NADH-quinone oxidoreductase subunit C